MHSPSLGARAFIPVAFAGVLLLGLAPTAPVAAAGPTTEARQIITIARHKLGDPWHYGAIGPSAFDCSGLVLYAFRAAGDRAAVGNGRLRTAGALYRWYARRGLANRSNPMPGDLVIWGRGTHVGIYIGGGKAISALTNGVRIHGVHAVTATFTAYLHTGMWKTTATGATVTTSVRPTVVATHRRTTRTSLNLRAAASIHSARIALLGRGRTLVVLGSRHDSAGRTWLHVRTGGRIGWVASWLTR